MTLSMDTQLQNFWVESINKEATLRFSWHLRYSNKFAKSAFATAGNKPRGKKNGVSLNSSVTERIRKMESEREAGSSTETAANAPTPSKDKVSREKGQTPSSRGHARGTQIRDMRPASTHTRSLLYNGISAHGEGRYAYLRKRKTLTPEKKFEFPILTSCQYGWKIMEFANPKPSSHARTCVIKDSFYRNSGIILG